ncbi:hypothetical protein ANTPLA_LOCUS2504 [Anthophora plagiata]
MDLDSESVYIQIRSDMRTRKIVALSLINSYALSLHISISRDGRKFFMKRKRREGVLCNKFSVYLDSDSVYIVSSKANHPGAVSKNKFLTLKGALASGV